MKKYSLLVIVLVQSIFAFCQEPETPSFEIPDFAPKTPEAAAFLKYGEYPVDLSTGVPNISIPLYTVDLGNYKLPISLNYHASGIKVSQEATWVGLGWNLNAGARVILSVRDGVDENNPSVDIMPDDQVIGDYFDEHPYQFLGGIFNTLNLDRSRVKDVYNFSSPTASGSFYINNFSNPEVVVVFPPDGSFKVELLGTSRTNMGFKITDSSGNIYLFNATKEKSERTMSHGDEYISAWYVDEISTSNNKKILFTYENDGNVNEYSFTEKIDISRNRVTYAPGEFSNMPFTCPEYHYVTEIKPLKKEGSTVTTHAKKIKEILFNESKSRVLFDRVADREDMVENSGASYLKFIKVEQKVGNEFEMQKGFEFLYSYFEATGNQSVSISHKNKRLKLNGVIDLLDGSGHNFVYSDLGMPSKVSKSQDYYGYYNDISNADLIPRVTYINNGVSTIVGNAVRNVNPLTNQAGVLTEIHYPTQGWTKFNYETNQYFGVNKFPNYNLINVDYGSLQGEGTGSVDSEDFDEPIDDGYPNCNSQQANSCIVYHTINFNALNASGSVKFDVVRVGHVANVDVHYKYVRVRIIGNNGNLIYDSLKQRGTAANDSSGSRETITATVPPHFNSGKIILEVYGSVFRIEGFLFQYANDDSAPRNLDAAGLRVSSMENYNHDNVLLLKKGFDYSSLNDANKTSGKLVNDLSTEFTTHLFTNYDYDVCIYDIAIISKMDSQAVYSATSNSRFGIEGNSVVYEYVREYNLDTFTNERNGYSLYQFRTDPDEIPNPALTIQTSWKRGKMLVKEDYKMVGTTPYILRREINDYDEDYSKTAVISGFKMLRNANVNVNPDTDPLAIPFIMACEPFMANSPQFVELVRYNITIPWFYLKSTNVQEYFYNANNTASGSTVNASTYKYSSLHLQLSDKETQNSKGETLLTKYFYPQDTAMSAEPFMSNLITKNVVAKPICIQTFNGTNKLSEQKTIYKDWGNNLILPIRIQAAKGNAALENRLQFMAYDQYGNPLEAQMENGTPVSFIWGYNNSQLIAKIEYATYDVMNNTLIDNAVSQSETGTESGLLNALTALRNSLPNSFVTSFTYYPLIGVRTVTDPKGYSTQYGYDHFGRLTIVKDYDNNVLSENVYHYKP
jgi:YD repeat-containing protein